MTPGLYSGGDTCYLKIEEGGTLFGQFFLGGRAYDSGFVRERGILGVLIISELVAGAYSLSIARGVLSNGAECG